MRVRNKIALGLLAGAGATWGWRAWLRNQRRIDLRDRVAIITGGATGHGLVLARLAARRGARLVLAGRDPESLRQAEADLLADGARDVLGVPTDVTKPEEADRLVARTFERHGRIDVLVNNAGIIGVGPLEEMTLDDFRSMMETNFWGALHCTMAVLPHMRSRRFGRIANVGSVGSKSAMPHLLPYTASKFALAGLTKGLRAELAAEDIFVTGVYPATMRTGGHTHAWFKGDQEAEYTWFALGDTLPLLSTSAETVAEALWEAVRHGDAEVNLGWQTHIAVVLEAMAPNLSAEVRAFVARFLPASSGPDPSKAIQGQDLADAVPDFFDRLVPSKARPDGA